jgi:chaperonin cofactor prefoldin
MAKDLEKSILEELKRFNQINRNMENLDEQHVTAIGNDVGGLSNLGMGSHVERLAKRFGMEMAEQEVPDADEELEMDVEVDTEETPTEDDAAMDVDDAAMDVGDEEMDMEIDAEVGGDEDTTELDVTDLVSKQDEVNTELSDQKDILSKNTESLDDLMTKLSDLETQLSSMEDVANKISSLEDKLEEYRPRTPEEKLGLRKHDSGPYNKTLSDFFTDKEEVFDKTGKKQYILTKDAVEDYSDVDIQKSFGDPDAEDEE